MDYETVRGAGNARGLATGSLFTLTKYPRDDQNREYLIFATEYKLQSDALGSSETASTGPVFQCEFTALDAKTPYRPPRVTPLAQVRGPQTAIVVGKSGEEIRTDQYGRVKVQFHWDRYGKSDQHSSCWMRVSHPWAGQGWGAITTSRIGQEVIVNFLEGDPDRPIITGRVYNGVNKPPYKLPGSAAVSGLKSNSTKGGSGYNEYSMDDTKGNELIREHGQFDKDSTIEHDLREHVLHDRSRDVTNNETIRIGKDRSKTIDHDETSHIKHDRSETVDHDARISIHGQRTETVDQDETITIHQNRTETVDRDETISIGRSRSETVADNETVRIGRNRKETVRKNDTLSVGANKTETVAIAKALSVGAAYQVSVGAIMNTSVGGAKTEQVGLYSMQIIGGDRKLQVKGKAVTEVGEDQKVTVKGDREEAVSGSVVLRAGSNLIIEAGASITLQVGGGWLVIDQTGVTVSNSPRTSPSSTTAARRCRAWRPSRTGLILRRNVWLRAPWPPHPSWQSKQHKGHVTMPDSNPLEQPRLPGWSTEALVSRLLEGPGRLFAVVNAARDAQVLMAVRGLGIEQLCLYAGDEAIRLAAYAPYLLSFGDTPHPLARYLDLGWFQQWGIFLRSALSVEAVASHLAGFMTVRVPGDHEAYFRFYDSWVLSAFLRTVATPDMLVKFFGTAIDRFLVEDAEENTLVHQYRIAPLGKRPGEHRLITATLSVRGDKR